VGRGTPGPAAGRVAAKRRRLRDVFSEILRDGVEERCFAMTDVSAVSCALLAMAAAIPSWYDPEGLQTPRRIARTYCDLAARMAGVQFADPAPLDLASAPALVTAP